MSDACLKCKGKTPNVNESMSKDKRGRAQRRSTCGKCGGKKCCYVKANSGSGLFTDIANTALKTASKANLLDVMNAGIQGHKAYTSANEAYNNVKNKKYSS